MVFHTTRVSTTTKNRICNANKCNHTETWSMQRLSQWTQCLYLARDENPNENVSYSQYTWHVRGFFKLSSMRTFQQLSHYFTALSIFNKPWNNIIKNDMIECVINFVFMKCRTVPSNWPLRWIVLTEQENKNAEENS